MLNSGHNLSPTTRYIQLVKCHELAGRRSGVTKTGNHCLPGSTGIVPFALRISTTYFSSERSMTPFLPTPEGAGFLAQS